MWRKVGWYYRTVGARNLPAIPACMTCESKEATCTTVPQAYKRIESVSASPREQPGGLGTARRLGPDLDEAGGQLALLGEVGEQEHVAEEASGEGYVGQSSKVCWLPRKEGARIFKNLACNTGLRGGGNGAQTAGARTQW